MLYHSVSDWTAAYAVFPHIPNGTAYPARWAAEAAAALDTLAARGKARLDIRYGKNPRHVLDLFLPDAAPKGLFVFIHGGFWKANDKSIWSQLATGALARGFAVAIPSYRLCPEARIAGIVADVATAITHAAGLVDGPMVIAGHSAGGHLVARMIAEPSPLLPEVRARIRRCMSISGLHDLRPLMMAEMNTVLAIDEAEAIAESPALLRPSPGTELIAWVGSAERAEFLRQNALLPAVWGGLGVKVAAHVEPDRHHFDILDALKDPDSAMVETLLSGILPNSG